MAEQRRQSAPEPAQSERRRRGGVIRRRWLINTLAAAFSILAVTVAIFTVSMYTYYTSTVMASLESRVQTVADMFQGYTESSYRYAARQYINQFQEKNVIEVQFLTAGGRILMSSLMDISGGYPGTEDVTRAIAGQSPASWQGRDPTTRDSVIAASAPIVYNGAVVGVVRMVSSIRLINRQMTILASAAGALALVILLSIALYSASFIRRILDPVSRVTETARRIAAGSYGVQMEKRSEDEMGELIDAINDMSLKIDRAEKTQNEFISSVSHELRTPLTAINGWAETLYNGEVTEPEDVQKGLGIVVSEARRLTNMVEELLEFSRIETGRFNLSVEPLDIKAELEDAVYTYREFFRRKGLELNYTECSREFAPIDGDPSRLRQVFCNLLDNADKHGGSGGRVDVSIDEENSWIVIRIRDYGAGIPADELPYVKYKFYKGSSKARGSGIGLAVCEEIIGYHGGRLDIENAEGGGCVVTVWLPEKEQQE